MTTRSSTRRDYLVGQRRTIIARSLAGSLAGAVPVPFLDDWAVGAVLGGGYRRDRARRTRSTSTTTRSTTLVHGTTTPPSIAEHRGRRRSLTRIASRAARSG